MPWILAVAVLAVVVLAAGWATLPDSAPVASESGNRSRPQPTAPATFPSGPAGELARNLRAARERASLTVRTVGERAGIAASTIDDFERAAAVPSAETLKRLSSAYGLSFEDWTALEIARSELH
ncbi:helix-turn-helix transcriptional regulator [Nonomuraea sp. NN258]|uniref:helix-turn-helix domain-containing protein n=1 Tax=Nonomuraea antri TaxID=2730852 RepID=UPI001568F125|nr:helix-turn-helix transcriptional regulator [Nonomuraea antri]NRQ31756.1 helix-turn-helix transcriptional regulator [Nonomuraea antri]